MFLVSRCQQPYLGEMAHLNQHCCEQRAALEALQQQRAREAMSDSVGTTMSRS
jgi:hypothetical protein